MDTNILSGLLLLTNTYVSAIEMSPTTRVETIQDVREYYAKVGTNVTRTVTRELQLTANGWKEVHPKRRTAMKAAVLPPLPKANNTNLSVIYSPPPLITNNPSFTPTNKLE